MALNVKFLKGTKEQYAAATKDVNTFYYTTDDSKVYLGTIELSTPAGVADAVALVNDTQKGNEKLRSDLNSLLNGDKSVEKQIEEAINEVLGKDGDLTELETTKKTIIEAINELKEGLDKAKTDLAVTLTAKETASEGAAKTYELKQGTTSLGVIDIPKDMVVESGRVVKNPEGQPAGTYIELTIANKSSDKLYINVANLVDIYTAAQNATQVQLAVDGYELSATIVAGSIGTTELADNAVTNAKLANDAVQTANIVNKNVTEAKLSDDVVAKLNSGNSALQKADITTGSANGTIAVDGDDVAVKGLGSAAYTDSTAYDAAGAANTVKSALEGTASDTKDSKTIAGAKKYADDVAGTAEQNAKDYADSLASDYATAAQGTKADSAVQNIVTGNTNGTIKVTKGGVADFEVAVKGLGTAAYTATTAYDAAGSASTAEQNAKDYTDTALTWGTIA